MINFQEKQIKNKKFYQGRTLISRFDLDKKKSNVYTIAIFSFLFFGVFNFANAITVGVSPNAGGDTLKNGLVGHWTFDGADLVSNVADKSGNGNNGNMSGFTSTSSAKVVGKLGQALKFDGVNDYVNNPTNIVLTGDYAISTWFFSENAINTNKRLISIGDSTNSIYAHISTNPSAGNAIGLKSVHCIQNTLSGGLSVARYALASSNAWHHVICNYSGGVLNSMYVDGVITALDAGNGTWANDAHTGIKFGTRGSLATFWAGRLDDTRIYSRTLSASEIQKLYNQGGSKLNSQTPNAGGDTLKSGLVGHWTFDGADLVSNVVDKSGNGNHGNMSGFTSTSSAKVVGKLGQALKFDGVDDYINAGDIESIDTSTALSGCAWVKHTTITNDDGIFAKITGGSGDGFIFFRDDVGATSGRTDGYNIYFADSGDTDTVRIESATNASPLNKWTQVCFTFQTATANGLHLYVNGVEDANSPVSTASIGAINAGTAMLSIGERLDFSNPFNGTIDDVRIYNRALSASEVKQLYNLGGSKLNSQIPNAGGDTLKSGLVGHWTFDGADLVSNVTDKSGNGNNGNMSGFTSTSSAKVVGKLGQALKFDGVNDYVKTGLINPNSNIITLTYWAKRPVSTSGLVEIEQSANFNSVDHSFLSNPDGSNNRFSAAIHGTGASYRAEYITLPQANTWNHYAIVFDHNVANCDIRIYLNGTESATTITNANCGGAADFRTDNIYMMSRGGSTLYQNGIMDDVRIYNRTLSATEIKQLYNLGK